MRACWIAVSSAALFVALGSAPARADDDATKTTAVVWLRRDADTELFDRVKGQVADLDVTLIAARRKASPGSGRRATRELGREHNATIVIWFRIGARQTSVYVEDLKSEQLLVRQVEHVGDDEVLARSAGLEAAAMVVRSTLRALLAGGTIGVAPSKPEPIPEPAPTPAPPPIPPPRAARLHAFASIGWSGAFTDTDTRGHHGVAATLGLSRGRWRAGVGVEIGAAVDYEDPMTTIRVGRNVIAAHLEARAYRAGGLELGVGVGGGVAIFERSTISANGVTPAAPGRVVTAVATPAARLRITPRGLPVGFELEAGADVLFSAPAFGYELDGLFVDRNELWPVAPRIGLAVVVEGL